VLTVNGHNVAGIADGIEKAKTSPEKAHPLGKAEFAQALKELTAPKKAI